MLSVKDITEIISEIERKIKRGEYERKIEYGLAYKINNKGRELELYVVVGRSKYGNRLPLYISPEEPAYDLILEEYELDEAPKGIIFLYRDKIDGVVRLKTSEVWDERLILAHELGHHIFKKNTIEPILHDNSLDSKKEHEAIKSLYGLLHFIFQINNFIYSQEVCNDLKRHLNKNSILNENIRELENYVREVYTFSMNTLKDFMILNEAYAIATEILTTLEWVRTNEISIVHAVMYLNNQFERWRVGDIHPIGLSKIFDGFNKNSRIWQLMEGFLRYDQISEEVLIKELEQKREEILREAKNELHKLPDKAGEKLREFVEKRATIENNLEMLKRELYEVK